MQSAVLRSHIVCLSVRPSVTLVDCDHIGWNTSEIISPLVSLGCSLSADPNIMGLLQKEHPQIWAQSNPPPVDLSVGDIRDQIPAEWLQIVQWSQWRAYRKPPSLSNGMFGSRVGFSGLADRMALFRVISNPRWRPATILENFKLLYLGKESCYPLHVKILL